MKTLVVAGLFSLSALFAQTGIVRSNGIVLPGVTITATQGERKLTTVTGEDGRYAFDGMTGGEWTLQAQLFGFGRASKTITIGAAPVETEWLLELQNFAPGNAGPAGQNGRGAGFQQLQNVAENQINAEFARNAAPEPAAAEEGTESFLINGSLSRGLQIDGGGPEYGGFRPGPPGMAGGPPGGGDGQGAPGVQAPGFGGGRGPGGGFGGGGFGGPGGGGGFGGPGGFGGRGGPGGRPQGRGPGGGDGAFIGNRARRGQNQIRGGASFSLRNSALDASPYSLNGQSSDKPSYAQSRFSAMLGGPLTIPKLLNWSNTFFFINYNGSRARNPYRGVGSVPLAAERDGDFSGRPFTLYDPATHLPFPGNLIPKSQINPISLGLLNFFPFPNQPGLAQNYVFVGSVAQNSDSLNTRLNQNIGKKDRLALTINTQRRNGNNLQMFGFRDLSSGSGWNSDLSWAHTFAPRFINNLHWAFNRSRNENTPFFAYSNDVAGQLGITGASRDPINYGPPNLSFTNYASLSDSSPSLSRNQTSTIGDSLTLTKGKSNLSFGVEYRRLQLNTRTDQNGRGSFSFSGLATSGLTAAGSPLANTGYDFADFLVGLPQSSSIRFGASSTYFRGSVYSGFFQDDWRLLPNFSLNLGLRYEYFTPLEEKYGKIANLSIAPGFTGVTVVTPATPGQPQALVNPDTNNLSPRIGIAWKPQSKGKTTIRAGYGIYYNSAIYNQIAARMAAQPPFANTSSVTTSSAVLLTLATGLTQIPPGKTVLNTYAVDPNYRLANAQTLTTSISQELPKGFVVELGYIGTKGTHLDIQRLPNRAAPGSPLTAEERRQIGNAVGFTYESAEANSIYHAAQVRVMRRFRRGVSGNLLYTFGKSIDNSSTFGGAGNSVAQDDKNLRAERGLSSFDQRHTLRGSVTLGSPVGDRSTDTWYNRVLKNWNINSGFTFATGTPLTARVLGNLADSSGTGAVGSGRADATGLPVDSGQFFNLLAFTIPPSGRFGNAGRNTIPGPSTFSVNASVGRSFSLGERRRLQFRVESNNLTNHVNITNLGTVVNAVTYGLPLGAGGMRTVQAELRLNF